MTAPDREHRRIVSDLLDECIEPSQAPMGWRLRTAVILVALWMVWMALATRAEDAMDGPEWSGVTHVDGR